MFTNLHLHLQIVTLVNVRESSSSVTSDFFFCCFKGCWDFSGSCSLLGKLEICPFVCVAPKHPSHRVVCVRRNFSICKSFSEFRYM